ncbi:hypothetical protein HXZ94_09475 [Empedobacter falsenii]|uniref:hypothetical protein n=1 Tax=Empedobacter falsenii TaxID=343874 RepID=UPI0025760450|nr:hypothetical protein [Empedobacter falsenii]MDM1298733.1 hypothetical protein [Empedobacter falsenii]MDM1318657.1 hypothetical protein [Empedobacter falsenii]
MKKFILFFAVLFQFSNLLGQVGIGTSTPNTSSVLDIDVSKASAKKGFLLPRLQLLSNTDKVTVENPAVGLLVYNLADSGSGANKVFANMYYFWNGTEWLSLTDIEEVKRELLPQVFFIAEGTAQTSGTTINGSSSVVVTFSLSSIMLNTGNNITLNETNNTFKINNAGVYEISGFINYNPSIPLTTSTNLEFTLEVSTDNGKSWVQEAKTYGVWGYGTGQNNRSNNIAPTVVSLPLNALIRCTVRKTIGTDHGASAGISAPTGLTYGKVFKIQKID